MNPTGNHKTTQAATGVVREPPYSIPEYARMIGMPYGTLRSRIIRSEVKPQHELLGNKGGFECKYYKRSELDAFFGINGDSK